MLKKNLFIGFLFSINFVCLSQDIAQGKKYLDIEQYGNARKTFTALVSSNPNNGEYLYNLGEYYVKMALLDSIPGEELDSAKTLFTKGKALQDSKYSPFMLVGLGTVKYLRNQWDSASYYFDQALKMSKQKNAQVFYKIGEAYTYKGFKDAAVAVPQLEKANKLDPKSTDILLGLGDAYLLVDRGNGSRARKQYETALELNPKLAKANVKSGKIYLQARNYEEALRFYNLAIEVDPTYSPAYRERAELYFKLKGYRDKAPAEYKKYLSMSDGNYKSRFRFAYFCFTVGDYDDAVIQLQELFKEKPNDRILYRLSAYCNYQVGIAQKDTVLAKKYYKDGLDQMNGFMGLTPDTNKYIISDYEYYGNLLIKNKMDSLGVKNLLKVAQKDTSRFEIYADLAKAYSEEKRYWRASQMYSKYFKYKVATANELLAWGRSYFNGDDFVKADTVFSKLIRLKPEEILGYKWRALSNARIDSEAKTGKAIPYYEKYIEMAKAKDPVKYKNDIIAGYTYIGKCYLNQKNYAKSKENWKKIIELDPNDSNANMVLKSLK